MDVLRREYPIARKNARQEIFRLQLLDEYIEDSEKESYDAYRNGEEIKYPGFNESIAFLDKMKNAGVKSINLLVVGMPLSMYTKYAIETVYLEYLDHGKETFVAERQKIVWLLDGVTDFWMFDNTKVLPMLYEPSGRIIGAVEPIIGKEVARYMEIKEKLLAKALPLKEFIRQNHLDLQKKKVIST
jgi:hypothetical protein